MSARVVYPLHAQSVWAVDPARSSVTATVRHLNIHDVQLSFSVFSGTITVGDNGVPSLTTAVDVASLDSRSPKRDDHLRNADFFDVATHSTAVFVSTSIQPAGNGVEYAVFGDLSIRDTTRTATFAVVFEGIGRDDAGRDVAAFTAKATINRKNFGVPPGRSITDSNIFISHKVRLAFSIHAVRQ